MMLVTWLVVSVSVYVSTILCLPLPPLPPPPPPYHQLGQMVTQVVREQLVGCYIVLAAPSQHAALMSQVLRGISGMGGGVVVVVTEQAISERDGGDYGGGDDDDDGGDGGGEGTKSSPTQLLLTHFWRESGSACRALVLFNNNNKNDINNNNNKNDINNNNKNDINNKNDNNNKNDINNNKNDINNNKNDININNNKNDINNNTLIETKDRTFVENLLSEFSVWKRPEARIVVVGGPTDTLLHPHLRNTRHIIHIRHTTGGEFVLTRRCLYCRDGGGRGTEVLYQGALQKGVLQEGSTLGRQVMGEPLVNLRGGLLRVVTLKYFPHTDYQRPEQYQPGGTVTPLDCLDFRILHTVATSLNFTYEVVEPVDGKWGVQEEGKWLGIVGSLEREEGDLSMVLTPTPDRLDVIDHTRIYGEGAFVIVSLKPRPPSQHWAVIKTFSGELWVAVVVAVGVWGVVLWVLLRLWAWVAGGQPSKWHDLSSAILFGFEALMQNSPNKPPTNMSAQMAVGWWWVFCIIVTTAYKSSLISHLTVPGKTRAINTFKDLLDQEGWTWSADTGLPNMADAEFFLGSPSADVREVYRHMKFYSVEESLQEVLRGSHSIISWKNFIDVVVESRYSDGVGYTPIYIPSRRYPIFGGYSWGSRKGAPFLPLVRRVKQKLVEAGLITYWLKDVIAVRVAQTKSNPDPDQPDLSHLLYRQREGQVILSLNHLQGAFFQLFTGVFLAFLILLGEYIVPLSSSSTSATRKPRATTKTVSTSHN